MTLSEPPLPTLSQLVRAIFTTIPESNARWYDTASEALAAAIHAMSRSEGNEAPTVWFPAYFCNEALRFVRRLPVNLRFYDVKADLHVDWERLDQSVGDAHAGILVLVHYFGFPNEVAAAKAFCGRRPLTLVEDAAHALTQAAGIGGSGTVIFSPRKMLAVPRGGVLIADERIRGFLPKPVSEGQSSEIWNWVLRRLIQRVLTKTNIPWHFLNGYRHPVVESVVPARDQFVACSSYVRRLIATSERQVPLIVEQRRAHYLQLLDWCKDLSVIKPMIQDLPDGVCPYVFPIHMKGNAQRFVDFLRSKGVPASCWPDVPPEAHDPQVFPQSTNLAAHTVLLPVHQSLTDTQMERMGRVLTSGIEIQS